MVLGIEWFKQWGKINWDFNNMTMRFQVEGVPICLKGVTHNHNSYFVEGTIAQKRAQHSIQFCMLHVKGSRSSLLGTESPEPPASQALTHLKLKFADIFHEPQSLPPHRGIYDHKIRLQPNSQPVNIRNYRYPLKQRDVIENLVQDMIDKGVIQPSNSPYASPVVLISKKDGSWGLCMDYRQLNDQTVKNKFPIPVLEELVDELAGSTFFSKIDLRSGTIN